VTLDTQWKRTAASRIQSQSNYAINLVSHDSRSSDSTRCRSNTSKSSVDFARTQCAKPPTSPKTAHGIIFWSGVISGAIFAGQGQSTQIAGNFFEIVGPLLAMYG
jgi:hypothetical protein